MGERTQGGNWAGEGKGRRAEGKEIGERGVNGCRDTTPPAVS